ncbi:12094_t:CDS:2 [Ambispora gerdemannii]|uniref:12094_t:CDS:1 n=1 Tax=Ambispora gerdemannii TaxID=144530 RepID=A0A9N9GQ62_9GLOM|nr:12094_t:CDS:2 [Ambispora gerdemannii]
MSDYHFGQFDQICYESPLSICNVFRNAGEPRCLLEGFLVNGTPIRNLGRTEMILFFVTYILTLVSQIVTSGGFLGKGTVLAWFSAANAGLISALSWILVMNAIVGFQFVEDGSLISLGGILLGGILIFVGVGYIALDTAFNISGHFASPPTLKNVALYITYIIFPLVAVVAYVVLETILVIAHLGDKKPLGMFIEKDRGEGEK